MIPAGVKEWWRPTASHARATVGAFLLAVAAVLLRRPDLVVLATPLAVSATWAIVLRPKTTPEIRQRIGEGTVREGQQTSWHVNVTDPEGLVDDVAAVFSAPRWIEKEPEFGQVVSLRDDGDAPLATTIRPVRWGDHTVRPAFVVASSGLNGFRWVHRTAAGTRHLIALPRAFNFEAASSTVRSVGLIGANRSPRLGSGTEFAGIRPFQPGDRLRRIHWAESLRSGSIHVTATSADQDRHIVLLVDAFDDVGESGGVDGRNSSLDITVRATAAMAEHFTSTGDRVTIVTMGARGVRRIAPSSGRAHLRRLLELIARVEPGHVLFDNGRLPSGLRAGTLVILLSPLVSQSSLKRLAALADRGLSVVAIDCLPDDIAEESGDPYRSLTWRLEILRRESQLRHLRALGIAIVPWAGIASFDLVLRGLVHRSSRAAVR